MIFNKHLLLHVVCLIHELSLFAANKCRYRATVKQIISQINCNDHITTSRYIFKRFIAIYFSTWKNLNNQCYKYAIILKTPNEYMTAIFNHTNLETTVKYNSKLMT